MIKTFNGPAFTHNKWLTGIVFAIVFTVVTIIGLMDFLYQMEQERYQLEGLANQCLVYERFQELEAMHTTEYCSLLLLSSDFRENDFREKLQDYLQRNKTIDGVVFAKAGKIDRVAYSKLLGHIGIENLLDNAETKDAAVWCRDHDMPAHVMLSNGYSISISPVYTSLSGEEYDVDGEQETGSVHSADSFLGFVVVCSHNDAFLPNIGINRLKEQGVSYEIYRKQPWQSQPELVAKASTELKGLITESSDSGQSIVDWQRNNLKAQKGKEDLSQEKDGQDYLRVVVGRESKFITNGSYIIMIIAGIVIALILSATLLTIYWLAYERARYRSTAMRDTLTGCYNSRRFAMDVNELLEKSKRFAICYIDLDKLKYTNDNYGHEAGDQLITGTIRLINSCLKAQEKLYRLGGDEFAIIFYGIKQDFSVEKQNMVLQRAMETPIQILGRLVKCSFSAGFVIYPDDGGEYDELLIIADQRMYEEKRKKEIILPGVNPRRTIAAVVR